MRAYLLVLLLAGCSTDSTFWHKQTPEDEARYAAKQAARQAEEANALANQILATYGPLCEKLGFQPNTDPWRNCVLSRYDADAQARAARRAAAIGAYGAFQANRPRNCSFIGNQMTCY